MKRVNKNDRSFDWDTTLQTLADPRRRILLATLADAGGETTLPDLSYRVVASEQNITRDDVTDEEADFLLAALHHSHVPKLVEAGIVEWIDDHKQIRLTESAQRHPVLLPLARWSRFPPSLPTPSQRSVSRSD